MRRFVPVTVLVAFILACAWSYAHPHDRLHPELDQWFMGLTNKVKTPCCDGSEAMRMEDVDWESRDGHYRVKLEGEWVDVPDNAVVQEPNRLGPTLVWPWRRNGKLDQVRCFLPGSMT